MLFDYDFGRYILFSVNAVIFHTTEQSELKETL